MSKRTILRGVYFLLTIPIYLLARFLLWKNLFGLNDNLEMCIQVVNEKSVEIPDIYVPYLVTAEDHRSSSHYGVDQIGMIRAVIKIPFSSKIEGASTIEQQFVRVVTGNYAYTIIRKFKEQLLAVYLAKKINKKDIAKAYLAIAYYGYKCEGVSGIFNIVGDDLEHASENQIISVVARLKYPKPSNDFDRWEIRVNKRINYIKDRHVNNSSKLKSRIINAVPP